MCRSLFWLSWSGKRSEMSSRGLLSLMVILRCMSNSSCSVCLTICSFSTLWIWIQNTFQIFINRNWEMDMTMNWSWWWTRTRWGGWSRFLDDKDGWQGWMIMRNTVNYPPGRGFYQQSVSSLGLSSVSSVSPLSLCCEGRGGAWLKLLALQHQGVWIDYISGSLILAAPPPWAKTLLLDSNECDINIFDNIGYKIYFVA